MTHLNSITTKAAGISIGGAALGELSPHPLQIVVWCIAIASGLVAIVGGIVKIQLMRRKGDE